MDMHTDDKTKYHHKHKTTMERNGTEKKQKRQREREPNKKSKPKPAPGACICVALFVAYRLQIVDGDELWGVDRGYNTWTCTSTSIQSSSASYACEEQ
jgi:hypothetical protein